MQAVAAQQGGHGAVNGEMTRDWPWQAHVHEVGTCSDAEAQADTTVACCGAVVTARCSELACSVVTGRWWHSSVGGPIASSVGSHERPSKRDHGQQQRRRDASSRPQPGWDGLDWPTHQTMRAMRWSTPNNALTVTTRLASQMSVLHDF